MKYLTPLAVAAAIVMLAGCASPTKAYVMQHPELSPEHRKIILSGRIKFGDPVEGMTREQVRLVMGTDPDQFDSVNGEDAWIWFKAKGARIKADSDNDPGTPAREGGGGKRHAKEDTTDASTTETRPGKVTVFFKGNVATHVQFGGL